jgi:hypothetical protein
LTAGLESELNDQPLNLMYPTCLHDELISNHATCCEHRSFFFGYYHRHLMYNLEVRLNYADECLRLSADLFETKFPTIVEKAPKLW